MESQNFATGENHNMAQESSDDHTPAEEVEITKAEAAEINKDQTQETQEEEEDHSGLTPAERSVINVCFSCPCKPIRTTMMMIAA